MASDESNFVLSEFNSLKTEIKQFSKLLNLKNSKYTSLCDMKKQAFKTLSTYSEEDLDFLKEFVKAKITKIDKYSSAFLPVMVAIYISIASITSTFIESKYLWEIQVLFGAVMVFGAFEYGTSVKRLNFYNMLLELIEKVEETREHTFNDCLAEQYRQSLTISEAEEATEELANDDLIEEI